MSKRMMWIVFSICIVVIGSVISSIHSYHRDKNNAISHIDQQLRSTALVASEFVGREYHDSLLSQGIDSQKFDATLHALSRIAEAAGVEYVYTVVKTAGEVIFTSSSATPEEIRTNDLPEYLEPYDDASEALFQSFLDGKVVFEEYTDQWGTFRSFFLPMTATDGTVFVIGVDIPVEHLQQLARTSLLGSFLTSLWIILSLCPFILITLKFAVRDKKNLEQRIADATSEILLLNSSLEEKVALSEQEAQKAREAEAAACSAREQAEMAKREGMLDAGLKIENVVSLLHAISTELTANVEQSRSGAEEQKNRTGETSVAMEQVVASVLEVAKNASMAAEGAEKARSKAQEGSRIVTESVSSINEVAQQTRSMKDNLTRLGQQAEEIGKIMNVIEDIADQTNLLALNAAIEAARAGDAGRGFAVVADEVRKLAEKTMNATKEVGASIASIQEGTRANIKGMEQAARSVAEATTLAARSGTVLEEIVGLVVEAADQVRSIATATEQQSAASEEVSRSVETVAKISGHTSELMNQSGRTIANLADQALNLQKLVAELKTS
ncbi:MAG: methyl-accepting chemotaxis protein [Desulfovibrionales bacterium]|nr:MAG: methyl-accepting chemotaxis protein [Desulfovibrionales bacterium]